MHWIAPSERDTATDTLEKRLWAAADQFRANSGLSSAQYSQPVLGLIFLRFAKQRAKLEKASAKGGNGNLPRRGSRVTEGQGAANSTRPRLSSACSPKSSSRITGASSTPRAVRAACSSRRPGSWRNTSGKLPLANFLLIGKAG